MSACRRHLAAMFKVRNSASGRGIREEDEEADDDQDDQDADDDHHQDLPPDPRPVGRTRRRAHKLTGAYAAHDFSHFTG